MSKKRSLAGVILACAAVMLALLPVAKADDLENDINLVVGDYKQLNLVTGGSAVTVNMDLLRTKKKDGGDIGACNVAGNHVLVLDVVNSTPAVASVSPAEISFDDCNDPQPLLVTPLTVGETIVTFTMDTEQSNVINPSVFNFTPGRFKVVVTEGGGEDPPPQVGCSQPAAPAWSAHILKASGIKGKQKGQAQKAVADHMGESSLDTLPTDFDGVHKAQRDAYGAAVFAYLDGPLGFNNLVMPTKFPPQTCTEIEVDA